MTTFRYSAYAHNGRLEVGTIDANSSSEALGLLAKRGLTPFEAVPARPERAKSPSRRAALKSRDLAHFSRETGALLEAGLPVDEVLRIVGRAGAISKSARLALVLLDEVTGGRSLAAALEDHANGAPVWFVSLVRAGEARAALGPTFLDVAGLLEAKVETEEKIRSALTYPLILMAIALGTLGVVVTFLFPALLQLFEDSGAEPPFVLAFVRDVRQFLAEHGLIVLIGIVVTVLLCRAAVRLGGPAAQAVSLLDRLPIIGPIRHKIAVAMVTRTLGTLLANGVPLPDSLAMAAAASPAGKIQAAMLATRQAVTEGKGLASTLRSTEALPEAAVRLAAIGEETGKLDAMLLRASRIYEQEASQSVDRAMTMLAPLTTVVIGLFVGGIIL